MESSMKSSSLMTTRAALLLVLPAVALGLNPPASSQTAARDYSFTISTTQAWTDTGIDLQAGDTIEVTATAAHAVGGLRETFAIRAERVVPIRLIPVFR